MQPAYTIRNARAAELERLQQIELAAAQSFQATPYAFLAASEPLALAELQHYQATGLIWVAVLCPARLSHPRRRSCSRPADRPARLYAPGVIKSVTATQRAASP